MSILKFDREEATRGHNTEVAAQGTYTANIAVADEVLDDFAVVENLKVDGINRTLNGKRGLELTELNGKFVTSFVLHKGINQHRFSGEVALNLVSQAFGEIAFQ